MKRLRWTALACFAASFALGSRASADTVAYYRFEEGSGSSIIDSLDSSVDGSHSGSYSGGVPITPIPLTSAANASVITFASPQAGTVTGQPFVLHSGFGNATLEFFIKAPDQPHHSIFWTRADDTDTNRFNIAINAGGNLTFDYREPGGALHTLTPATPLVAPASTWTHVAVTRTVQGGGSHLYQFYINGVFIDSTTDATPNLPTSTTWKFSGRSFFWFTGDLDEVRFSNKALSPNEFLLATGTTTVADPASSRIGATVQLKATVTRNDTNGPLAGMSVVFKVNGGAKGSGTTNASGVATLNYIVEESVGVGSATIDAVFEGANGFAPSTGSSTLTVAKGNTKLKVANVSGMPGAMVTLKARLRNESKQPIMGRTIQFKVQNTVVGSAVTGTNGWAELAYTVNPNFKHNTLKTITATFSGDAQFNAKTKTGTLTVL